MKLPLILKNSKTSIEIHKEYLVAKTDIGENIIAYRHIDKIYINKHIQLNPYELLHLCLFMEVWLIDRYGNILAKVELV